MRSGTGSTGVSAQSDTSGLLSIPLVSMIGGQNLGVETGRPRFADGTGDRTARPAPAAGANQATGWSNSARTTSGIGADSAGAHVHPHRLGCTFGVQALVAVDEEPVPESSRCSARIACIHLDDDGRRIIHRRARKVQLALMITGPTGSSTLTREPSVRATSTRVCRNHGNRPCYLTCP